MFLRSVTQATDSTLTGCTAKISARQPTARDAQQHQNPPEQHRVRGVQKDVNDVIARRIAGATGRYSMRKVVKTSGKYCGGLLVLNQKRRSPSGVLRAGCSRQKRVVVPDEAVPHRREISQERDRDEAAARRNFAPPRERGSSEFTAA